MGIEVGSYEAKTKLPELLRGVRAGNRYTITLRGEAIAELVPADSERLAHASDAVDEMLAFMRAHADIGGTCLKALIEEGRE